MAVLGLHKDPWHDTGAAIIRTEEGGRREIVHVNEERLDRVKQSRAFPDLATAACLAEFGLDHPRDVDLTVIDYRFDPSHWAHDNLRQACRTDVFLKDISGSGIVMVRHHLCHAASCFFTSPFEEAAILVVDGFGSQYETQTLWLGSGNDITLLDESHAPGIGLLYEAVTRWIGFEFLEAGKTMGLAPFGKALPQRLAFAGVFDGIATDYSAHCDFEPTFRADGPPPETFLERARCAYDVQEEALAAMQHLAVWARRRTGAARLCLSGGVALNVVANTWVRRHAGFEDVYVNPACSDAGLALGAALWGYHGLLGLSRSMEVPSPFVGPSYPVARARAAAIDAGLHPVEGDAIAVAADMLARDQVIGVFEGRSEMGPRALGHRSILMSPCSIENRDRLNAAIKRREPFRPFAPCVALEAVERFFDWTGPSPHMLYVAQVRDECRARLPAVTHVDGTARMQTVSQSDLPRLHALLSLFEERTGVPVLINTSFNVAGEPIVETPEDAVRTFHAARLDALLMEGVLYISK